MYILCHETCGTMRAYRAKMTIFFEPLSVVLLPKWQKSRVLPLPVWHGEYKWVSFSRLNQKHLYFPAKSLGNHPSERDYDRNHDSTEMTFTLYMYEHFQVMTTSHHMAALVSDRQVVSVVDDRWSVVTAQTWTFPAWHRSCICSMSIGHTIP